MYDEKGNKYLDCINNVAHGKLNQNYVFKIENSTNFLI